MVEKYQVKAIQAAYLILGERNMTEDITHSAFLTAAEKIHHFDSDRPFGPWFYRIVANASIKARIREHKQLSLNSEDGVETHFIN
ncbi:MAG: sigma factor [Anaerolineaceae bacterium]